MRHLDNPALLVVDLFCGAGGFTSGAEHSTYFDRKVCKVIACVNHDENAIASHAENHPECQHFQEDIRTLDLTELITQCNIYRALYPNALMMIHSSLECTNFSKAKGGLPRNADSRTLAEHLFRYLDAVDFDIITIENVEEFMSWGPLDAAGKPLDRKKGQDYVRWCNAVQERGYHYDYRLLNAADFGAYTSRTRYFGVFAKEGRHLRFPQPTHAKNPTPGAGLKKWKAVRDVLDFSDEGESIFGRKKNLSENTLARVHAGLVKYIAKGKENFIQKHFSGRPAGKVVSTDQPAGTLTTVCNQSLVQTTPISVLKYNSTSKKGVHVPPSLDQPAPVVSTQGRLGLVQGTFLQYIYTNHYHTLTDVPAGTLTTKDRVEKVSYFLDKQYSGPANHQSVEQPAGTIMPNDKHALVQVEEGRWLLSPHYQNGGTPVDAPAPTITDGRKHHCLMFPQWGVEGCCSPVDAPSRTLIARMDKTAPHLIEAEETGQPLAIQVFDTDSPMTVKIKEFMAQYGIVDIKMRMLRIPELKRITGFPEDYVLKGNQAEAKKYIGNAIVVPMAQALVESLAAAVIESFDEELLIA
jgi:DNA (cytosine-5)-methyltransferase 1